MKRILYTLVAAGLLISSCQKEQRTFGNVGTQESAFTDADFSLCRASQGSNKKNSETALDLNYDLAIKEVSENKYKIVVKMNGIRLNGQKMNGFKDAISGVVIALNNTKEKNEVPLNIILNSTDVNGDKYQFPHFEYKGDLTYEMLEVKASFRLKEGSIKVTDKSTFTIGESTISVSGGNIEFGDNSSFRLDQGTSVTFNGAKTETNFAILFEGIGKGGSCDDEGNYFILPQGHSVEQNPTVKKVNFPADEDGRVMKITVVGDPEELVSTVFYTPAPVPDPNNPDVLIQPAAIQFHKGEPSEKKVGLCCYFACVTKDTSLNKGSVSFCGKTDHFKPAVEFGPNGPGWDRITLKTEQ